MQLISINLTFCYVLDLCSIVNGRFNSLDFTPLLKPPVQKSRKQILSKSQDQKLPHHQLIVSKFPSPPKLQLIFPSTTTAEEQVYLMTIINFHNLLPLFCIISFVTRDLRNLLLLRKLAEQSVVKESELNESMLFVAG